MPYQRKTRDMWHIQVKYTAQYGYETVCIEETFNAAKIQLKTYRENEPQYPSRIVMKREKKG